VRLREAFKRIVRFREGYGAFKREVLVTTEADRVSSVGGSSVVLYALKRLAQVAGEDV
jgi:hypothetical protein